MYIVRKFYSRDELYGECDLSIKNNCNETISETISKISAQISDKEMIELNRGYFIEFSIEEKQLKDVGYKLKVDYFYKSLNYSFSCREMNGNVFFCSLAGIPKKLRK